MSQASAAPGAVNAGTHAAVDIAPAVSAILGSQPFPIDYYSMRDIGSLYSVFTNTSAPFTSVATGLPDNHAPYTVLNASVCQYSVSYDENLYPGLLAGNAVYTIPVGAASNSCGFLPAGTHPGTLISSATSTNSHDGGSGWGVEWALSASYKGLDTTEDSWDSAETAGFYLAMASQHPSWNFFDIKGAFRQSASGWSTGYSASGYGYGIFNYDAATAIAGTSSLYLQPPGLSIHNHGYYATLVLLPFRQARRANELIYSVNASYSWPVKNEYSATDIAASGGTLVYTSNGTDVMPTFNYMPALSGTATFVAFTADGAGHFSRVESFGPTSVTITVTGVCVP